MTSQKCSYVQGQVVGTPRASRYQLLQPDANTVVIAAAEYAKMAVGVAYSLQPANGRKGYEWKVRDGLTLTR